MVSVLADRGMWSRMRVLMQPQFHLAAAASVRAVHELSHCSPEGQQHGKQHEQQDANGLHDVFRLTRSKRRSSRFGATFSSPDSCNLDHPQTRLVPCKKCLTLPRWEGSKYLCQQLTQETKMLTFQVNDMTCGHCVSSITKAIKDVDMGAVVTVDLATHLVHVKSAKADALELREAIAEAGYAPVPVEAGAVPAVERPRSGCCCGSGGGRCH